MALEQERTITSTIHTLDCCSTVDISPKPDIMLQDDYENQLLQSAITYAFTIASLLAKDDPEQAQDYQRGIAYAITR